MKMFIVNCVSMNKYSYIKKGDFSLQSEIQRKFEYQAGTEIDTIWEGVIQFRPSGIRVKRPTCFPALVAMVQIPIIGRYKRRLSVRECGRLQSFPESFKPCENTHQAYKQFGNSVNVKIIELLYNELIKYK